MKYLPVLLSLLLGCASAKPRLNPTQSQFSLAMDSTVYLQELLGGRTFCSGVISGGYIYTAYHCVDQGVAMTQVSWKGQAFLVNVALSMPAHDLAVLRPLHRTVGEGVPIRKAMPAYGETVFVFGHAKGDAYPSSLTRGVVSHPLRVGGLSGEMTYFQHDAGTIGGNSGGPVIIDGELAGLVSFSALDAIACAFACPGMYQDTHISGAIHTENLQWAADQLRGE